MQPSHLGVCVLAWTVAALVMAAVEFAPRWGVRDPFAELDAAGAAPPASAAPPVGAVPTASAAPTAADAGGEDAGTGADADAYEACPVDPTYAYQPVEGVDVRFVPPSTIDKAVQNGNLQPRAGELLRRRATRPNCAPVQPWARGPPFNVPNYPVNVIGRIGAAPWGNNAQFADPDAMWIWNEPGATRNAAGGVKIQFQGACDVTADRNATVHAIVDNHGEVHLNGKYVAIIAEGGWQRRNYSRIPIQLISGTNVLTVHCYNAGGPAGLVVSVIDDHGEVLLRSDARWRWS
jgi:hypothetical protein